MTPTRLFFSPGVPAQQTMAHAQSSDRRQHRLKIQAAAGFSAGHRARECAPVSPLLGEPFGNCWSAVSVARPAPADDARATSGDLTDGRHRCAGKRPGIGRDTARTIGTTQISMVVEHRARQVAQNETAELCPLPA